MHTQGGERNTHDNVVAKIMRPGLPKHSQQVILVAHRCELGPAGERQGYP